MCKPNLRINTVYCELTDQLYPSGAYVVNDKGRFVWLQRLAHWVMKKFGREFFYEIKMYHCNYELPVDGYITELEAQIKHLLSRKLRPTRVFVGMDAHDELREHVQRFGPMSGYIGIEYRNPLGLLFSGLPVTIVPWLNGVFVAWRVQD